MQAMDSDIGKNRLIAELRDLVLAGERAAMIHAVVRCGIPDQLADGPLGTEQLAERTGTVPEMLRRVLRALVPSGLLTETAGGEWVLTPLGEWLRPDRQGSLHPVVIYASEPWMRGAWGSLEHGLRTGGVPFENANGVPYFDYLDHNPEARRIFDSVMATRNFQRQNEMVTAYDWGRFRHIVDVGGGQGILLFGLLRAHPASIGTVFDLPEVAAVVKRYAVWEGLVDRIEAVGGNFFSDIPPCGDALVLSRILNDWPDEACVTILSGCRAAISPSGELLILERVIEDGIGQRAEKEADVHMHVVLGGKVRTRAEFTQLLAATGFVLDRIVETSTADPIIVGRPV